MARPLPTGPSTMANRVNPVVILGVALIVAAVAGGAWLGKRHTPVSSQDAVSSPDTETAADTANESATPVEEPTQKRRSVRAQTHVRSVARGKTPIDRSEALAESASEAADVTETAATPPEAVFDPIVPPSIEALPEDDYIYSREGAGVIAPRLTSLGFVHRLVFGLRVRTSTIELLVTKSGTVERAKIFSTPAHWQDALLLSRAKTFRFVPAYRNGFPVRYRFVMDVDTSP